MLKKISIIDTKLGYSNLYNKEGYVICSVAADNSIVIKQADKGSSVIVGDLIGYIKEAMKQLNDSNVYKDATFNEKIL